MRAVMGNRAPIVVGTDDQGVRTVEKIARPGKRAVTVRAPEGTSLAEMFSAITAPNGVWDNHADKPPAWVASDSPGLAQLLSEHYGCPVRELDEEDGE